MPTAQELRDEAAILAAIQAAPDDDLPRLAYADWCEERGQYERAELVRLQCLVARGEPHGDTELDRIEALIGRNEVAWTAHLPHDRWALWRFRRGFPEELEVPLALLLEEYEKWAPLPNVRSLCLTDTSEFLLPSFARQPWAPGWIGLELNDDPKPWMHDQFGDGALGVGEVVSSPQARQLRELRFGWFPMGERDISALCGSPYLDGLTALEVPKALGEHPGLVARFGKRLRVTPW